MGQLVSVSISCVPVHRVRTCAVFGCDVANGANGELFLARCAWALLRENGGVAIGNTGVGWDTYAVFGDLTDGTPAASGAEVRARIRAGGAVNLEGETWLEIGSLRRVLRGLRAQVRQANHGRPAADRRQRIARASSLLDQAERLLNHPTYSDMHQAHELLRVARGLLSR